jgi:hypothetical protein
LYKVPLKASAKKDIMVNAVKSIYNGAPRQVPPQQYPEVHAVEGYTAWDLQHPGGATDVCIRIDYPFLQPSHLEQELRGGPLHLNTSVFRGFLILQGVELLEERPAQDEPALDKPALDELALDEPSLKEPAGEEPPLDEPALDEPALDELALEKPRAKGGVLPKDTAKEAGEVTAGGSDQVDQIVLGQAGEGSHGLAQEDQAGEARDLPEQ